jgi:hypothetical protein
LREAFELQAKDKATRRLKGTNSGYISRSQGAYNRMSREDAAY